MSRRLGRLGFLAVAVLVGVGATALPATAADPITISGTVSDLTTGSPIATACVTATQNGTVAGSVCADASGHFDLSVPAGYYQLRASAASYRDLWFDRQYLAAQYRLFDAQTTADFPMVHALPTATGLITDPGGNPVSGAHVTVHAVDGSFSQFTYANGSGQYSFAQVPPIPLMFETTSYSPVWYPTQWVPGKTTTAGASTFTPGDGESLVVNEQFLPHASLTMTFTDKATGTPVSGICFSMFSGARCSDASGMASVKTPFGTYTVEFTVPTAYLPAPSSLTVTLLPGETKSIGKVLTRRTSILVTAHDRGNLSWQPPACVIAVPLEPGVVGSPGQTAYRPGCGGYNSGPIEIWLDDARPVQLFAYSGSTSDANGPPQFGAQWVGETSGSGDRRAAKIITPTPSVRNGGPAILLDRPAILAGSVGDNMTDEFCVSAVALPLTVPGESRDMQVETCSVTVPEGAPRFSINGLGPYAWPLYFTSKNGRGYAWSGGASNRLDAILVGAGDPIHGEMPGAGGSIQGTITGGSNGELLAYDAITGDYLTKATVNGTAFTIGGLITRPVILQYRPVSGPACWPIMPKLGGLLRTPGAIGVLLGETTVASVDVAGCRPSPELLALRPAPRSISAPPSRSTRHAPRR